MMLAARAPATAPHDKALAGSTALADASDSEGAAVWRWITDAVARLWSNPPGRSTCAGPSWRSNRIQGYRSNAPSLIACCARAGDLQRSAEERAVLDGFAPDFVASLFRGENRVFTRPDDMEHLLDGLRLAAGETT